MTDRFWPLGTGRIVTSPFGPRQGGYHYGVDFGRQGGSADMPVYAVQAGTVIHAGAAQGYGGPDPAGWLVIDSSDEEGGGCLEYGHIIREVARGDRVRAGQRIGRINPNSVTNGGVAPHLHLSDMPRGYDPAAKQNPLTRLAGAREPGTPPPTAQTPTPTTGGKMRDPFTGAVWSPNYHRRTKGTPRWIGVHTQEARSTAHGLAGYTAQRSAKVSYHVVVDDREKLKTVAEVDSAWSAAGANDYAFHICGAGTFAGWSRGKWLETDISDGVNEDMVLTHMSEVIAWWCDKYRIPPDWIGGRGVPWGRDGICGHVDFGQWGGGHTDPGVGFPVDEMLRRVRGFLVNGQAPAPLPPTPPIVLPGTAPVTGVLLYRGRPGMDPAQVRVLQQRLKRAYSQLAVDGVFGPHTEAAVRDYQHLHPPLVADGIVGPATAAALGLRF